MPVWNATWSGLNNPANRSTVERYEAFQAGGGGLVKRQPIVEYAVSYEISGDEARLSFSRSGGRLEALVEVWGFPENWKPADRLYIEVETGDEGFVLGVDVLGARNRLGRLYELGVRERRIVELDLIDLPLTAGIRAAYQPTAIRLTGLWGGDEKLSDYELAKAAKSWDLDESADGKRPEGARRLMLHRMWIDTVADDAVRRFRVDQFGQRANTTWPEKITSAAQLVAAREAELKELAVMPNVAGRDEFGGWADGPKLEATGFFRVTQADGIWWLVDPLGHVFFSVGTTGVRTTDNTIPDGREELFEALPPKEGRDADAWLLGTPGLRLGVGFYRWNILRKYGSKEAWRDRVCTRFKKWGFNTIANWSEDVMLDQRMVPHVRTTASSGEGFPMATNRFADVYDPRWLEMLDRKFAAEVAPHRDNPWVIGYFVDNEAPWGNMRLLQAGRDSALRKRWQQFCLEEAKGDLNKISVMLGQTFTSWDDVAGLDQNKVPTDGDGREMMRRFEAVYAEAMFKGIRETLLKHDPNHMYLGCRFVRMMPDARIVAANGRYADVVSVNCYDLFPRAEQFDAWHAAARKPIMMGEHHFPLLSQRQLPPLYPAFTAEERYTYYVNFLKVWASKPYTVGSHWFQHADQAVTGRGSDGENQLVGFVDITDQPHKELVTGAQEVSKNIYQWHAGSRG